MYTYNVIVTKIYDGDTITVDVDLGFGIWMKKQSIRLIGINTPEIRGDERERGLISRDALREKLEGETVTIRTYKDKKGKYGRWLAEVFILDAMSEVNINQWLINEGYAEKY